MTLLNRSLFQDGFKTAAQTGLPANGLKSVYFQDSLVITPVAPLGVFHIYQNCDPDTGARRYEISPSEGRFCARPKSELVKGEWEVLIKTSEYVEGM